MRQEVDLLHLLSPLLLVVYAPTKWQLGATDSLKAVSIPGPAVFPLRGFDHTQPLFSD